MRWTIRIAALGFLCAVSLYGQSNLDVTGLGFFKDRSLDARLTFLHDVDPREAAELDAALLEDSAFLLLEQVKREGYLQPTLEGRFRDGEQVTTVRWDARYSIQLDVDFVAEFAELVVFPGVLFYYDSVVVSGVDVIPSEQVQRFFIPGGVLFMGKRSRVFTHENLDRRTGRLLRALDDLGYRSARTVEREVKTDTESGAVQVHLKIDQGPLFRIGEVEVVISEGAEEDVRRVDIVDGTVLTRAWEQAERSALRNEAYRAGYPDVKISQETLSEIETKDGDLIRNLRFYVKRGQKVKLAGVRFVGDDVTKRRVLLRQADLEADQLLDLIEVSDARRKLMGLGIYKEVGLSLEPAGASAREVIYELIPNDRKELQLRGGWGSYELARLGFRWEHRNPWGSAHRYEVEVKQSLKATLGEVTYSIPQVFGTDMTLYLNSEYNFREEVSYDRTTQGVAVGTSTLLGGSGVRLSAEYGFAKESSDRDNSSGFDSEEDATVASIAVRASLDRRDDFLAPTSGYNLFASIKVASQFLGGSVDFQKFEIGGAYHFSLTDSMIVHAGLRYGAILSTGDAADNIPFNERFFLGGENSVRGYREGTASPLDLNGDEIGAETYVLGNIEIEQRILPRFSVVAFVDTVANARSGLYNEGSKWLYSVGLGLRYNTVVGPVRLEYGHNPDPRPDDPEGTLHFSIGFPF